MIHQSDGNERTCAFRKCVSPEQKKIILRSVEFIEGGTHVHAVIEGESTGFLFKLLGPLLDRMVASSIKKDYARLKQLLESQT